MKIQLIVRTKKGEWEFFAKCNNYVHLNSCDLTKDNLMEIYKGTNLETFINRYLKYYEIYN
jgi:hypothetical protein